MLCRPLCSTQDTTPNVDYFTRDEIRSVVKDFKTKVAAGEADAVSNFSLSVPNLLTEAIYRIVLTL